MGVTGDFKGLEELARKVAHLATAEARRDLNRVLAEAASTLINDGFRESRDPYGRPWPALTSRTGKPLLNTGAHLKNTLGPRATAEGFTVSTAFKGAGVHQYGAVIRPKNAKALAFTIKGANFRAAMRSARRSGPQAVAALKASTQRFAKSVTIPRRQYMPEGDVGPVWRKGLERAADDYLRTYMERG